jgi:hypothetical protein
MMINIYFLAVNLIPALSHPARPRVQPPGPAPGSAPGPVQPPGPAPGSRHTPLTHIHFLGAGNIHASYYIRCGSTGSGPILFSPSVKLN